MDGVREGAWFEQGANYIVNYANVGYLAALKDYYTKLGKPIPTWENGSMPTQFRDTEFEIPAQFARGKSSLSIIVKSIGSLAIPTTDAGLTNEYQYWAMAHGDLPVSTTIFTKPKSPPSPAKFLHGHFKVDVTGRVFKTTSEKSKH